MPSRALLDSALVDAVSGGDEDAAALFVRLMRPRLESLARFRGYSAEDAEEIAQDTLLAVVTQLRDGRFERRSQVESWMRAIFDRRAIDHLRRRLRHDAKTTALADLPAAAIDAVVNLAPAADSATTVLVRDALAHMGARHRLVILLNVTEGVPSREIARMLRIGTKSAEALLTAARKQFRLQVHLSKERSRQPRLTNWQSAPGERP